VHGWRLALLDVLPSLRRRRSQAVAGTAGPRTGSQWTENFRAGVVSNIRRGAAIPTSP
jgi:hypothetical protein